MNRLPQNDNNSIQIFQNNSQFIFLDKNNKNMYFTAYNIYVIWICVEYNSD